MKYCFMTLFIGPCSPTGFNLTRSFPNILETTVLFEWDLPQQDGGPEAIVDIYTISISPTPLSHPTENLVSFPPWNVTLAHNTPYTVNITATNCAGTSEPTILADVLFGKLM